MTGTPRPGDRRLYRLLLLAFPRFFRERYGAEMEEAFLHLLGEARAGGRLRVGAVWIRGAWDAVVRGGKERLTLLLGGRPDGGLRRTTSGHSTTGVMMGMMGTLASDVRFAVRTLVRRPVFFLTAVLTLTLGIGANGAVFSVVNGLLIQPFPYPEPEELVRITAENERLGWSGADVNMADAQDWKERSGALEDLAVWEEPGMALTGGDRPELVEAIRATLNVLSVLGVEPTMGRDFAAFDGREGAPLTTILSHGLWESRFGADPAILGSTVMLDGEAATVVGVLPDDFVFLDERPGLFVPLRRDPTTAPRGSHDKESVARLRDGVTVEDAQRAVNEVSRRLQAEHPDQNEGWTARVVPLREDMLGDMAKQASFVLMGAVGFVLLMACTNVANLLLARGNARRTEVAIRSALGAGRGRIVRQLLVESGVLAFVGGALGLLLAYWGERAIVAGIGEGLPPVFEFGLDGTVLLFVAAISILAALLFGLVPALRTAGPAASELREGGRGGGVGRGSQRFGSFLVVAQTALAVVLLVGGGIMVRNVMSMTSRDMGFEPEGVLTLRINPPEASYPDNESVTRFWSELLERVRGLPGVEAAGAIHSLPLGGSNWGGTVWVEGVQNPETDEGTGVRLDYITPGYLETMGVAVVRGRAVEPRDRSGAAAVTLVNESFVRRYAAGEDGVGMRLVTSGAGRPVTVVGVVEDHLERAIDQPPEPTLYLPLAQRVVRGRALVVRTEGEARALIDAVQGAVTSLDPNLPVYRVKTMDQWVVDRASGYELIAQLMAAFALISLALGAVGIYGVTAYGVGRRRQEIGVRLAMGADRGRVVALVLREGMLRSGLGLVIGIVLAYALSRVLAGLLVGVSATDPLTFGVVTGALVTVAFLGTWLPARRAARVSPVEALGAE